MLFRSTVLAALGLALAGTSGGLIGLAIALAISGCGSATQHPLASGAVSRAYGADARAPLGIYNFSGDIGKAAFPAAASLLLIVMPWRVSLWVVATAGLAVAVGIWLSLPQDRSTQRDEHTPATTRDGGRGGFELLFTIGVLDTAVRMGFLTFLPFLLQAKHAELPTIGLALALVFIGGAAGKFACGWLGARIGVLWTVLLTEGGTALAILAVIVLPLSATLVLLPLLGIMLNGTSSVLYGTVPDLAPRGRTERAFAVFYTGTIGAGAVAPVLFGFLGDVTGPEWATAATAATALATIPLALILSPRLDRKSTRLNSSHSQQSRMPSSA